VVVARDIGNGAILWQHPLAADERLAGYDVDANAVYLVVQTLGLTKRGTTGAVVALDPRAGLVRWRHALPTGRIAGPAVRGGLVAVPVDSQYVILLDGATGMELAQVLSTAEAATFVRPLPEGMFYGSRGVFLLSPATARGSRQAPALLAKLRVRASVLLVRPLPSRAGAVLGHRSQPSCGACREGDRARFRDDTSPCTTTALRVRRDVGTLRWRIPHPSDAVGRRTRQRDRVRQRRRRHRGARSRHGARRYESHLRARCATHLDAEGSRRSCPRPRRAPDRRRTWWRRGAPSSRIRTSGFRI
jgi:hypothetical protein